MKTNLNIMLGSLFAIALLIASSSAAFAVPHDAGWKARGMRDQVHHGRTTYYSAPATSGRQSFSYNPPAQAETPRAAAVAPAPRATTGYRSYSYQPQTTRSYSVRRNNDSNHYGGNYRSKATLFINH
ncbi:MAG TPA: hypothetical protein VL096_12440 [Pirellulaceae bacterium]|nr:hypothetical protein [Pirellulaceae bacterium]